jgi:hypothetical protein
VINLELQNKALLLKQLHKFYMKANTPWVSLVWSLYGNRVPHAQSKRGSFWWRDIFSLVGEYRSISRCKVASGSSVLFWKDYWSNGGLLCNKFPRLYSYALDEDLSVADLAHVEDLSVYFALPMSVEAFREWQEVSLLIQATPLSANEVDHRTFVWGDKYAPSKYYKFLFGQLPKDIALNAIWKSKSLPKLKVFVWLLLMDRLNTRDLMLRKHWHIDSGPGCVLCARGDLETRDHLFFDCDFTRHCWLFLNIHWDFSRPFAENFVTTREAFGGPCFMEVFACAAWNIWKVRNDLIFNSKPASFNRWKVCFQSDVLLHKYKVKSSCVQPLVEWLLSIFV